MIHVTGVSNRVPIVIALRQGRWHARSKEIEEPVLEEVGVARRQDGRCTLLAELHQHAREARTGHRHQCRHVMGRRLASIKGGVSAEKPFFRLRSRSGSPRDPKPGGDGLQRASDDANVRLSVQSTKFPRRAHIADEQRNVPRSTKYSTKSTAPLPRNVRFYPALKLSCFAGPERSHVISLRYYDRAAESAP